MKGTFITFEGGEGTGKSTQMKQLASRLEKAGYSVVQTREPGGTPKAESLRALILAGQAEAMGAEFEALLFAAARIDHVETVVAPALEEGKIVLCDRFSDSTRVYQGGKGDVAEALLDGLERVVREVAWPDLTVFLDLAPETGMQRARNRLENVEGDADRFEREDMDVQKARRAAFLAVAEQNPERSLVIDAAGDIEAVHDRIWKALEPRLPANANGEA